MSIMKSSRQDSGACLNLDKTQAAQIIFAISNLLQKREELTLAEVSEYLEIQNVIRKVMKFSPYEDAGN